MRTYQTLYEAISEIQRDISKGPKVISTRVQQFTHLQTTAHERLFYDYAIYGGFPDSAAELVEKFAHMFPYIQDHADQYREWLEAELLMRLNPDVLIRDPAPNELKHPKLVKTIEGSFPSYTYPDRLRSAVDILTAALVRDPQTRRAYWPIYERHDATRMAEPTRIPCSLGYQLLIRDLPGQENSQILLLCYLQRSCDFDHFWLSDVWLAHKFQEAVLKTVNRHRWTLGDGSLLSMGAFTHFIMSIHSFNDQEIY